MMVAISMILGYLLGAIPFAWIVSKIGGVNIFKVGSGNAGFTNVFRVLGFKYAIIVLLGDILKGTAAAALGNFWGGNLMMVCASVAAIVGHTFNCFIGFKGGKGVATGAGIMLFVSPLTFIGCAITLASLAYFTGYMSVGSLAAAILCPVLLYIDHQSSIIVLIFTICALYVIWMHRSNIVRLLRGTENKIRKNRGG